MRNDIWKRKKRVVLQCDISGRPELQHIVTTARRKSSKFFTPTDTQIVSMALQYWGEKKGFALTKPD